MDSLFKQQTLSFSRYGATLFPWLLLAQAPEGALALINKASEMFLSESPKLAFIFLYPIYCLASALSALFTLKVILSKTHPSVLAENHEPLTQILIPLSLTATGLGLVMIPATLALILPGIYVLGRYLFLPFLVFVFPRQKLEWYFLESTRLFNKNKSLCFMTACFTFLFSIFSFLGVAIIEKQISLPETVLIFIEILLGVFFSFLLNTWTATLFLEISKNERPG